MEILTTKSFTYPFKDPAWKQKWLVASLLILAGSFIPILPYLILAGYYHLIMRHVISGEGDPVLPEWKDWGTLLLDGLKVAGTLLVYTLPSTVFMLIGYGFFMVPYFGIIVGEMQQSNMPGALLVLFVVAFLVGMILIGIGMFLSILTSAVTPIVTAHVAAKDKFSAAFRIREWFTVLRANWAGFLVSLLIIVGLGFVLYFIFMLLYMTLVLCCLIPIALSILLPYILFVSSALFAQAYRAGAARGYAGSQS